LSKRTTIRLALLLALIVAAAALVYWRQSQSPDSATRQGVEKPVPVRIGVAELRDVPEVIAVTGFVTPLNVVDIRPQVTSTVRRIDIKEGQTVQAGQRMLTLDDRGDAANADKANAQIAKDQALLDDARRTLARNRDLKARGFVSQSVVDSAQSNVDALIATLQADRAAMTSAQVTVDYSAIKAPMSGRVGEIKVHVGSLVQPNSVQPIATITQIAPIDVAFNVPEREVQKLLSAQRTGPVVVRANVEGKTVSGQLSFVDSAVDSATGSLKAKAEFENRDALLWAGALVNVDLSLRMLPHAVVISPRAVQVGPNGQFVYRIEADGTVSSQPISVDYLTAELAVVRGLSGGSRVVTEGGQNLRPGTHVTVTQADKLP
jgi:RND family efflux transporter MFP subunit